MKTFNFLWSAFFSNSIRIDQIDSNSQEHRFAEVMVRFNDLVFFNLSDKNGHFFSVNLKEGMIGYNDLVFPYRELENKEKKNNIRLIYFRRNRITVGLSDLKEQEHTVVHYLGFQWQTKENQNRQIVLQINENGEFFID